MESPLFPGELELEYLGEGAANIVYKIHLPPPSPGETSASGFAVDVDKYDGPPPLAHPMMRFDPIFEDKLLRLRKDVPTAVSVKDAQDAFEDIIKANFDANELVEQIIVLLPRSLIEGCNKRLRLNEARGLRPKNRVGTYLDTKARAGTLVADMTARGDPNTIPLEFKPKWLAQSPTAPKNARRCRTCALHAMRNVFSHSEPTVPPKSACPLYLVEYDNVRTAQIVEDILHDNAGTLPDLETENMVKEGVKIFIHDTLLLTKLRDLQTKYDPKSFLDESEDQDEENIRLAMTLRDCTLFLKIRRDSGKVLEARLGDLDLKSSKKLAHWKAVERQLIDSGWYSRAPEDLENPIACRLGRP
ncbi:Inositol-pentakisphosphate 2-kinase [Agyrium rufum]|nr:Inositol-pentakisphosphate 2-kinase [Agyrium rufum]